MTKNEEEFKKQSYFRLLKYTKPYKFRLAVGIIAGFIVGGSMFGTFMVIPTLISGVVEKGAEDSSLDAAGIKKAPAIEKTEAPEALSPKLSKELKKLREYSEMFHLPLDVKQKEVIVTWPFTINIPVEDSFGKITWQLLSLYAFAIAFGWLIKNLFTYINRYYTRWVGTRVIADLRNKVFSKLLDQSLKFYNNMEIGQLISRCTNDTAVIESAVANTIADATRCPIEILACVLAILVACIKYHNYTLLVVLFIGAPLCVLPVVLLGKLIRKIYKGAFAKIADVVSRMHEVFTGILIVKAYHMEEKEAGRFKDVNRKYFRTVVHALKLQLMMAPLMETVAVAATLAFLIYCMRYRVTLEELGAMLVPAFMAYRPMKSLAKVTTYLQRSMAAADRYFDLLDKETGIVEKKDAVALEGFKDKISFNNVIFSYEENGRKILNSVNFEIKKGSVVAVVGETGSGKTTIANLIARFYDVDSGSVEIDGINVMDMKIDSLRDHIGIISQNAILFNDTIANNIGYGSKVSREEIENAAKLANAHDFIVDGRHKEGYDTIVGDKGGKLSGGEKQRVSIARAILKNPEILILDEATSALDTVTERLVQDSLNKAMENRTVFAIAHRLSTIQHANMIIVLDKGNIVERGTHEELLQKGGIYKKLHDTQFGQG
jgi:subfamily B ATP-binding cassette protein MsbA